MRGLAPISRERSRAAVHLVSSDGSSAIARQSTRPALRVTFLRLRPARDIRTPILPPHAMPRKPVRKAGKGIPRYPSPKRNLVALDLVPALDRIHDWLHANDGRTWENFLRPHDRGKTVDEVPDLVERVDVHRPSLRRHGARLLR